MKLSSQNEISCVGVKHYLTFEGQLPRYVEKARKFDSTCKGSNP